MSPNRLCRLSVPSDGLESKATHLPATLEWECHTLKASHPVSSMEAIGAPTQISYWRQGLDSMDTYWLLGRNAEGL